MKRYTVYINDRPYLTENRLSEANCEAYMHSDEGIVTVIDNISKKVIWTNNKQVA